MYKKEETEVKVSANPGSSPTKKVVTNGTYIPCKGEKRYSEWKPQNQMKDDGLDAHRGKMASENTACSAKQSLLRLVL